MIGPRLLGSEQFVDIFAVAGLDLDAVDQEIFGLSRNPRFLNFVVYECLVE